MKFEGHERLDLINRLSTNEVKSLEKFHEIKTILTSDKGRFIDLLNLYNLGDLVFASCSTGNAANVLSHLDKYTIMDDFRPTNMNGTHETILFYGDGIDGFIKKVTGIDISSLTDNNFLVTQGRDAIIAKNDDPFGGVNFIYSINDSDYWNSLIFSEENIKEYTLNEITSDAYEVKRIELGIPKFGNEISELTNPLECGMNKYVSFTKGCYIGQEVIARLDAYDKISKHMVGFEIVNNESLTVNERYKITRDGKECGFVTSAAVSENFGSIGLGFVKTIFLDHDKEYKIKYNESELKCSIVKLPFTT
ncbi:MAG: glycine cleavage T C-terminal barrel domain-containing protein [Ignavibacteria bacterium]